MVVDALTVAPDIVIASLIGFGGDPSCHPAVEFIAKIFSNGLQGGGGPGTAPETTYENRRELL
jgi:hypothetical protein